METYKTTRMQKLLLISVLALLSVAGAAQPRKANPAPESGANLASIQQCISATQDSVGLFVQNFGSNSVEHDVNSIILDIEKHLDSLPKNKTKSDALLIRYFAPLRLFFLTTENKTTVATSFLYADVPYHFCSYNDTALALCMGAIKNGNIYNLAVMTERRVARTAMETCLLPALKALDEFKEDEPKYVALSIYYGCRDNREGGDGKNIIPFCMTFVARMADIHQYNAGLITAKGLLAAGEVFLSDGSSAHELNRISLAME